MKILLIHNHYQLVGGEDEVFERERELLVRNGHEVEVYVRSNQEIAKYSDIRRASLAFRTTWAWDSYRELADILDEKRPDIAHFHNTFPLISPAAYYACAAAQVPVVQTLHNPRLLCPAATLFREGQLCEECAGRGFALAAVRHSCYQGSRVRSAVVASMLSLHGLVGTWARKVDRYIASTKFYRQKFIDAGIPADRLAIKPHFVDQDPGCRGEQGKYALFVGRLAPEKGVPTLLAAWKKLKTVCLYIRGEGPLADSVSTAGSELEGRIIIVPRLTRSELFQLIKGAAFLIWPSEGYYETFGLIAIEAFACGVPVICSRLGAMEEIVQDGRTGLHFTAGDASELARRVEWAMAHLEAMRQMGGNARTEYEEKYTAQRNYEILSDIYRDLICSSVKCRLPKWRHSAESH